MTFQKHIPNLITLFRLILCVPLLFFFYRQEYFYSLIVYTTQEILDQADGKLATRFNWKSKVGAFFDPLVDSLTHLTAFSCFLWLNLLPLWMFFIFLLRELGMMFLRLLSILQGTPVGGHLSGRIKALIHAIVLWIGFLSLTAKQQYLFPLADWFLIAVLASVGSGIFYLYRFRQILKKAFL